SLQEATRRDARDPLRPGPRRRDRQHPRDPRASVPGHPKEALRTRDDHGREEQPSAPRLAAGEREEAGPGPAERNNPGADRRRDALAVDDTVVRGQIAQAWREALALALGIAYPTKETIRPLLAKAHTQALGLAVESEFPTKESIKLLLAKAHTQMLALVARAPGAAD